MRLRVAVIGILLLLGFLSAPVAQRAVVLFDDFELIVDRDDVDKSAFLTKGWSGVKSNPQQPGAHGWIYTTSSIPGHVGPFPGGGTRVLVLEARPLAFTPPPGTDFYQTDFYLQFGSGSGPADAIPGDVWFQFWIYPLHNGTQTSTFGTREKFLYACNTDYPCHSHTWMLMNGPATYDQNNMFPIGNPSQGEFLWVTRSADGVSQITNPNMPDAPSNIGQQPTEWVKPNRWTLVKMHFNTSMTTGNSWETWLRPYGSLHWTKVAEWIGGVTPGFTWNIPAGSVGGHRVLRMPTTVDLDSYLYLDDFTIARSESALRAYTDGGTLPPPPPPPPVCTFTVAPTSITAPATGGSGSITVTASDASCAWTASSAEAWVLVGAGGSGSGSTTYQVAANTGTARAALLSVATQTVNVSQDAAPAPPPPLPPPPPAGCVDGTVTYPAGTERYLVIAIGSYSARVAALKAARWTLERVGGSTSNAFVVATCAG